MSWMSERNALDVWRVKNPGVKRYTWTSNTRPRKYCRLDFFIITSNLFNNITNTSIFPGYCSDHSCIRIVIKLEVPKRGRGFWKFNKTLLEDINFVEEVKSMIVNTIKDNEGTDSILLWDTVKCMIRGVCIRYGAKKKREYKCMVTTLTKEIGDLEKSLQLLGNNKTGNNDNDVVHRCLLGRNTEKVPVGRAARGRSKRGGHQE